MQWASSGTAIEVLGGRLGLRRASIAFKQRGLDPRAFGSWVQNGYLGRQENRRCVTS